MHTQRGGTVVGLIIGLLLGLGLALAVAIYVNKVPVPFVNKVPQRTPEQDAAEAARNRDWDPNAPLYGKNPAVPRPLPAASAASAASESAKPAEAAGSAPSAEPSAPAGRDPAAILNGVSTDSAADPFIYYVQAGAFGSLEEAEQQRARVVMLGMEAHMSEREQAGRTMYRVRVGPFDQRESAEEAKTTLGGSGIEAALVRVQRRTSAPAAASS